MKTPLKLLIASAAVVLVAGGVACNREEDEVKYVKVPKEHQAQTTGVSEQAPEAGEAEEIAWNVPAGWQRKPGPAEGMRYATFDAGDGMEVTVVPLGGEAGSLVANVNRWEGQLGLPASSEAELAKVTGEIQTEAGPGVMVHLKGEKQAMLAGMVKHGETTWFIKLTGPVAGVEKQQDAFEKFVKSTHFAQRANEITQEPHENTGHSHTDSDGGLTYAVPAGWEKQGPKPMREVWFTAGPAEKKAEIIVTKLPQGVGDLLSNVNRWRGQVGLAPVDDTANVGQDVTVDGVNGKLYDFTGDDRRQIVVMVNKGGNDWFVKVIGPNAVVEGEKAKFMAFLGSLKLQG